MKDDKPTSFDIAYLAGVSQSTVSRALRGSPLVNLETRQKVEEIARQLNYQVDRTASRLRGKQTKTIALLLCEDPGWGDSQINPFFVAILSSIAHAVASHGYDLLLSFQQLSDDWGADFESAHRADGIILLGYGDHVSFRAKLEQLQQSGAHFVSWGSQVDNLADTCIVGCDNFRSGQAMTEHLLALGRQRIVFIGDISEQSPEFAERYQGYCQALTAANSEPAPELQVNIVSSSEESGYQAIRNLMQKNVSFDAVFGASDLIALGALQALVDAQYQVPDQVSVVGFDDIPIAAYAHPPLTTMRQDTQAAGTLLVDKLLKIIAGETVESVLVPTELVIRKSCSNN